VTGRRHGAVVDASLCGGNRWKTDSISTFGHHRDRRGISFLCNHLSEVLTTEIPLKSRHRLTVVVIGSKS
jgi:hypothetical protein